MTITEEQQAALEQYVNFCSRMYDEAFQSLKRKRYAVTECRHFATFMLMLTVDQGTDHSSTTEDEMRAIIATLSPGGSA